MAWNGYFTLDGTEIVNVARTEAYAATLDAHWLRAAHEDVPLAEMLGHPDYVSPVADTVAPSAWYDPDVPASGEFMGLYPVDVEGIENSSRSSTVVESTIDGGTPGRVRHGTKSIVFNGVLVATTEAGVEYGMRWLRRALLGAACDSTLATEQALGADLTYLSNEPKVGVTDNPQVVFDKHLRTLRRFAVTTGPSITMKRELGCGHHMWQVTFTGVAGTPTEFGVERPHLLGLLDPAVVNPVAPGVTATVTAPQVIDEVDCGDPLWEPLNDPTCPALVVPPAPPAIPLYCYTPPTAWSRRLATINAPFVPLWDKMAPRLRLNAPNEVRNVRLRFYPDPNGDLAADPTSNMCGFTSDIVVSYIPAGATMTIDAATEEVYVETVPGVRRRADWLVFNSRTTPIEWPALSCGYAHALTVDLPVLLPPTIDRLTTAATGGTVPEGTHLFSITSVTAAGETTPSATQSIRSTGSTSTVTIGWGAVPGATSYNIYQHTTDPTLRLDGEGDLDLTQRRANDLRRFGEGMLDLRGVRSQPLRLLATVTGNDTEYVWTGTATTATNPPATNTAVGASPSIDLSFVPRMI